MFLQILPWVTVVAGGFTWRSVRCQFVVCDRFSWRIAVVGVDLQLARDSTLRSMNWSVRCQNTSASSADPACSIVVRARRDHADRGTNQADAVSLQGFRVGPAPALLREQIAVRALDAPDLRNCVVVYAVPVRNAVSMGIKW